MSRLISIIFLIVISFTACRDTELDIPKGFAQYSDDSYHFKLISAEGLRIVAYKVDYDPGDESNIDTSLWVKEMELVLKYKGHSKLNTANITSKKGLKGIYSEYQTYYNGESYLYGVTIFIDGDDLYIVESGGKKAHYLRRKEDILQCVQSFRPA
ncbi:MAG: hypothetical protein OEZ36_14500 [Spirochaetota bacterium]|nr:hypothetical protein [Spirochaetota bacterium]